MAGINFSFVADARKFLSGTKDIEKGLEDVSDALDDVARDADTSADKISDSLSELGDDARDAGKDIDKGITGGTKDATDSGEKLEKKFRDVFDSVKDDSKKAGDDLGDNVKKGTSKAGEGLDEFKDEANSTAKETAASFDGSADSIAGMFQETAANAFAGFGPAGAAAGIAVAAGIGIAMQALQAAADKANELTENAAEFAVEWAESDPAERVEILRDRFAEVQTAIADVRSVWEVWQQRAVTNAERFAKALDLGVINAEDLNDAFKDPNPHRRLEALGDVLGDVNGRLGEIGDAIPLVWNDFDADTRERIAALQDEEGVLKDVKKAIEEQMAVEEAATAITEAMAKAQGQTVEAYEASQRAAEATAAANEAYAAALAETVEPLSVYDAALDTNEQSIRDWATQQNISVDEARAKWSEAPLTMEEVLAELAARVERNRQFEANLSDLAARGYGALAEKLRTDGPTEQNAALVEMLAHTTDENLLVFARDTSEDLGLNLVKGTATGIAANQATVDAAMLAMYAALPLPPGIKIPVSADLTDAESALAAWINKNRNVRITPYFGTGTGIGVNKP